MDASGTPASAFETTDCRIGVPADAACIGALATHVYLDTYAPGGVRPEAAREALRTGDVQAIAERLHCARITFLLAEREGGLVGYAELERDRPCPHAAEADVELVRLYVLRHVQRQGIGRNLLRACERAASAVPSRGLWLAAWAGNTRALAFYRAMGYADVGAMDHVIEGQAYENRVLVKQPL